MKLYKQTIATPYDAVDNVGDYKGRASRSEYLWSSLLIGILLVVMRLVLYCVFTGVEAGLDEIFDLVGIVCGISIGFRENWLVGVLLFMANALAFYLFLAVVVRRLHDLGMSGWLALVLLLPTIGKIGLALLALIPSSMKANRWGPIPYMKETGYDV